MAPLSASDWAQPYFESVPETDTLANGIVTHIRQDTRGLIWYGTPEGLVSFDGYRLRSYRHNASDPTSIGDDYVRALLAHSNGELWVATQSAGISIFDPKTDSFRHIPPGSDGLPGVAVLVMSEAPDGSVFVGLGNAGLAQIDATGKVRRIAIDRKAEPAAVMGAGTVRSLAFDASGQMYIGTGAGLWRRRADGAMAPFIDALADRYIYALRVIGDQLWIGTQAHGAAVLDLLDERLTPIPAGEQGLAHPWVSGFVEVDGEVWVHTYGGGISVVNSGKVRRTLRSDLSVPGGLALDRLTEPLRDRSGLIWIGTWGAGLQKHNPLNAKAFRSLRHSLRDPGGLSHPNVLSTLPIHGERALIGTDGLGIDVLDFELGIVDRIRADPTRADGLRDGTVRAMARTAIGEIYVGTQLGGVQRWLGAQRFSPPLAIPASPVRRLLATPIGLVVGLQGGLVVVDGDFVREMMRGPGAAFTDPVWSLAMGTDALYVGTPNVLLRWGRDEPYPVADLEAPRGALDLRFDGRGTLWMVTAAGLFSKSADSDRFEAFPLPAEQLIGPQLLLDGNGRMFSPRVLIDIEARQSYALGLAEGIDIGSIEVGAASATDSGLMMFGGTRGLLIVDPSAFKAWSYEAPMLLSGVEFDGIARVGAPHIDVPTTTQRLGLAFAALDYLAPSQTRYRYRLHGLDRDWIDGDARQVSYQKIWPGRYRFEVAASVRGKWGTPLTLDIEWQPAFWQRPSAWALGLLAAFGLIVAGWRWRSARLIAREHALERLVEERTQQLSAAKERAETALDTLRGAQRQLVEAEKMASLGQLVAGVAHEINTPVGVAVTAASHLDDLANASRRQLAGGTLTRQELQRWQNDVQQSATLILNSLRRASDLVASFKQVSVDQSSGQRRRVVLGHFLHEVDVTLHAALRRTAHQLSIDCTEHIEFETHPGALFQVLTNLVNNALLHAFDNQRAGKIRVTATKLAGKVVIEFVDDGCGMDAETAKRAFDPFFTTRRGSGGSGLGLHIVHNLVTQLLGGSIELKTAPGEGTRFLIRLPL